MVEFLCDRVGVMYHGKLVETGPARAVFEKSAASIYESTDRGHSDSGSAKGKSESCTGFFQYRIFPGREHCGKWKKIILC